MCSSPMLNTEFALQKKNLKIHVSLFTSMVTCCIPGVDLDDLLPELQRGDLPRHREGLAAQPRQLRAPGKIQHRDLPGEQTALRAAGPAQNTAPKIPAHDRNQSAKISMPIGSAASLLPRLSGQGGKEERAGGGE